jgi:adenylate cyclase
VLPPSQVSDDQVRSALERVLAAPEFVNATRLSRFLRFAVEKSLAGAGTEIKEYLLGVEVFDRGQDFDPRLDPIVRVEAGRLRGKLEEYYAGGGQGDHVRIIIRKGSYAPTFEATAPVAVLSARSPRLKWVAAAVVGIGVVAAALLLIRSQTSAGAEVVTIAAIPSSDPGDAEFADALTEAVSMELSKNPGIRVVAWPVVTEYRTRMGRPAEIPPGRIAKDLGVETVLEVVVRQNQDNRRIAALLINPERGWKEWAGEYERGTGEPFAAQRELARAIAEEVRLAAELTCRTSRSCAPPNQGRLLPAAASRRHSDPAAPARQARSESL